MGKTLTLQEVVEYFLFVSLLAGMLVSVTTASRSDNRLIGYNQKLSHTN
ncbi:hypothetical protein GXM_02352 [Nostoc sphaeroides CCNUC1]|uniref:Uncharacterized protein n=1 Tax=Nostoc sphaeroides CCNUC1 TaxID=2653204 RepID=A0A5P8VWY0_9NOSO|nr:hypothetical protein GXM_02352 [Nostoc sphaeroides CCNUC1]